MTGFVYESVNTTIFFETDSKRKTKAVLQNMLNKAKDNGITFRCGDDIERLKIWTNKAELEEDNTEYFRINGIKYLKTKHKLIIL